MNSPAIPEGPGSVAGAPNLPDGFAGTFTSRYIDTGDLRQHVVTGGDGPPLLLLLHGWPQTWYAWRLVMPALARDFLVVAPDQRGCGLSGRPGDGYDTGTLAADPGALHASFAIYRALDDSIAQNQRRKTRRLPLPVPGIGGEKSLGPQVADTRKLAADDVQTLVVPGSGHHPPEEAPGETLAALTAFLAPVPRRAGPLAAVLIQGPRAPTDQHVRAVHRARLCPRRELPCPSSANCWPQRRSCRWPAG
jgi:pimeloyl-ACP methyl ester carboxylesterase